MKNNPQKPINQRGTAGNIPVYCRYDEIAEVEKLKPNPRNYNRHQERQIKMLAKIILANGWRQPIKVSTLSGFIVGGHARLEAARILEATHVPVEYQHYENEKQEYEDLIADNRIALLADEDQQLLRDLVNDAGIGIDAELAGLTAEAMGQFEKIYDQHDREVSNVVRFPIVCLANEEEYNLFQGLKRKYGASSDEAMFTICLEHITGQKGAASC